jgi:hypothetical protein
VLLLHVSVIYVNSASGQIITYEYITVQYSAVEYSTVQYNAVQYSTVQYSTVQCSTVQYSTMQYSTVQYSTVQYSTVQYQYVLYFLYVYKVFIYCILYTFYYSTKIKVPQNIRNCSCNRTLLTVQEITNIQFDGLRNKWLVCNNTIFMLGRQKN